MKTTYMNYTPIQLKLPVDLENIIEINDAVYAFNEVVSHIDLKKYFVEKGYKATGRPRYEREKLLKVLLFAFMEQGYPSLREIEKLCKVDIRFIWLRDEMKAPSYATLCDFINQELSYSLEEIVQEINNYIFDRIIRLNYELTSFHKEVLDNLNGIHGALLRMNRSIQSEGTYGEIKANRGYERFRRRGINKAILEIALISCGFNLHKYNLSRLAKAKTTKAAG